MIKLIGTLLAGVALLGTAILAGPAVAQTPAVDVCANIPGDQATPPAGFKTIQVRYPETGFRSECVRIEVTPTPVATPAPDVVVVQCEGPYSADAPYARFLNSGYGYGMNSVLNPLLYNQLPTLGSLVNYGGWYPYAAVPGRFWPVPTLVTLTNGAVTNAWPNHLACMPVAPAAPVATPAPAATPAPQVIVVQQPAPAAPVVSAPAISPPRTGNGGLLP